MPKKEVNLLPQEEFEKKPLGKLLLWALNVGRWIVIVTELIVILAFLSRFKLDRDLADLYGAIRAKQAIIGSFVSFEKDFRALQSRLTLINQLEKSRLKPVDILETLSQSLPQDVALTKFSLDKKDLTLSGLALSQNGLKTFLNALGKSPSLTEINLSDVKKQKSGEEGIQFNLTAKIKNQGGENAP